MGARSAVTVLVGDASTDRRKPSRAAKAALMLPGTCPVEKPMTSATSRYSSTVQLDDSGTREPPEVQCIRLAWPRPKLCPSSWARMSARASPLTQDLPPPTVASPAQPHVE
jgi:hypothetical protein